MALPNDKLITCTRLESEWIQNGGCNEPTPFAIKHGRTLFDYTRDDTGYNRLFNEAMASDTPSVTSVVIEHFKGGLRGLKSLVDSNLASAQLRSKKSNTDPRFQGWTRAPGVLQAKNQSGHAREAGERPSMECSMENSRLEQQKNFLNNTCDELAVRKENGDPTLENVQSIVLVGRAREADEWPNMTSLGGWGNLDCQTGVSSGFERAMGRISIGACLGGWRASLCDPFGWTNRCVITCGSGGSGVLWAKNRLGWARKAGERPSMVCLGGRGHLGGQTGETMRMENFRAKSGSERIVGYIAYRFGYNLRFWR
ncbi:glycoalkaloid metabolism 1 precursor [Capsicum annuum]|nr:glycoalkaloid metabolism 1 precursor [Capsicum annuum]